MTGPRRRGAHEPVPGSPLTPRQLEILPLLAEGLTNPAIGAQLYLTEDSVKTHVHRMAVKLRARNRAAIVHRAWQAGYLKPGGDGK